MQETTGDRSNEKIYKNNRCKVKPFLIRCILFLPKTILFLKMCSHNQITLTSPSDWHWSFWYFVIHLNPMIRANHPRIITVRKLDFCNYNVCRGHFLTCSRSSLGPTASTPKACNSFSKNVSNWLRNLGLWVTCCLSSVTTMSRLFWFSPIDPTGWTPVDACAGHVSKPPALVSLKGWKEYESKVRICST